MDTICLFYWCKLFPSVKIHFLMMQHSTYDVKQSTLQAPVHELHGLQQTTLEGCVYSLKLGGAFTFLLKGN